MEDLPGFPIGLLVSHSKETCRDILLDVMKEHIDSQWFHINDLPKPIRRVFYARMKQVPCGINLQKAADSEPCIEKQESRAVVQKVARRKIEPTKGQVMNDASSMSDDVSVKSFSSLNKVTTQVREKVVKRNVLHRSEAHLFPKQGRRFKTTELYDKLKAKGFKGVIDPCVDASFDQTLLDEYEIEKAKEEVPTVEFGSTSIDFKALLPTRIQRFWKDVTGYSLDKVNVPKYKGIYHDIASCICKQQFMENDLKMQCDIIYKRETKCEKMYLDFRVVRTGAYEPSEFPSLFKS